MTTAEEVEKAVERLAPQELARFRAWFEVFAANCFDAAIEGDAKPADLTHSRRKRSRPIALANPAICETFRIP